MTREASPPSTLPPAPAPRWTVADPPDPETVAALEAELSLPPALCAVLAVRGFRDGEAARRFLRPPLPGLTDPDDLPDVDAACDRIRAALDAGETVLVHGDYDVDGISGTALVTRWLRRLGGRVEPFVPHRLRDGYDFGPSGLRAAREAGAGLVVTVDCGIRAHDAVREAVDAGIDVVITDHHRPGAELPPAGAVVNPARSGAEGAPPLSGTGVAYALCRRLARDAGVDEDELHHHLDLVALATVADLVPLTGDNRILTRWGLKALVHSTKPGVRALLERVGLEGEEELGAGQVGWVLGPRINAAGRVGEARAALRLLLTEDPDEARTLARRLDERNRERKDEDERIREEALELLAGTYDPARDFGVVLASEDWHPGVIGIVASRVVERIHRPAVLVALDGDSGRGSARSVRGFHLAEALEACGEHLERFGGHEMAAGLDVRRDRLDAFRRAFGERAREALEGRDLRPALRVDLEISLEEADEELHRFLRYVGPFGIGNPRPVFAVRGAGIAAGPRVVGDGHLKLTLARDGHRLDAIGFGLADRVPPSAVADGPVDAAFQLRENVYRGRRTLQARLLDLRASPEGGA